MLKEGLEFWTLEDKVFIKNNLRIALKANPIYKINENYTFI